MTSDTWERLFVAMYGIGIVVILVAIGVRVAKLEPTTTDLEPLRAEVHALHEVIANQQAGRCMVINTPSLDVYHVENLGTKKVSKP